jgi:L-ascorbate metabolism protein UlaG (beta-lactamase superfamily)
MNNQKNHRQFPVIKNNRFYNHADDHPESLFFDTIPMFISSLRHRKKRLPANKAEWISQDLPIGSSHEPVITWIGHATFLIQVGGVNIITDPVFGNASPFFPRILPAGIGLAQLPPIDVVILSHNHRDHCDLRSLLPLQKLHPNMTILVAQGDKNWLEKKGFNRVIEHNWWDAYTYSAQGKSEITFTFLPANHWSAHGIFDRNKSLWGSWMIEVKDAASAHGEEGSKSLSRTIYFAGDTAYGDHFKNIAIEFPTIHTALMPIAPGEPNPWMRKTHMDADQAVQAFIDLQAHHFMPMHWGTFQFGLDTFSGPIERLTHAWHAHQLHEKEKKLTIAQVGKRLIL